MAAPAHELSRRERQIMDVLHRRGPSTVGEVLEGLPEPPGYSAVRALLRTMEEKGHVTHSQDGPRYVYQPVAAPEAVRRSAVEHLVQTFFDGSTTHAVAALLGTDSRLAEGDVERILRQIDRARKEGR
jgi:predicted transcriptional regulator